METDETEIVKIATADSNPAPNFLSTFFFLESVPDERIDFSWVSISLGRFPEAHRVDEIPIRHSRMLLAVVRLGSPQANL